MTSTKAIDYGLEQVLSKKTAFFVTPIGEKGTQIRKRADDLLDYVLNPSIGEDFEITRADRVVAPGSINHDVIRRLHTSDLVVADLQGLNPNVMYEVGVRHSFNLPIVHIAQNGERLPFDITAERTLFFDLSDLASVELAKEKISESAAIAVSEADNYSGPIDRVLNAEVVFRNTGDVGVAIELMAQQIQNLAEEVSLFDPQVEVSSEVKHLYSLFQSVYPYEIDQLIDKLRKS